MLHVTGARLRLLLAAVAGTCLLLLGMAGSASASTYSDLQGAKAGDEVVLSDGVSLIVGDVSTSGDTTRLTGSTLDFDGISGTGVTGTLTESALTLTGGDFVVPASLSKQIHTIDAADPFVATFAEDGSISELAGDLVSTDKTVGAAPAAFRTFADDVTPDDVQAAIPPPGAGESYRFALSRNGTLNQASQFYNSWTFQVFLIRGGQEVGRVIDGITFGNTSQGRPRWRYEINLNYPLNIKGQAVTVSGRLTGDNLFNPGEITGVSGAVTGQIELTKGVYFTGGSVSWDQSGFSLSGGARVDCAEGSVSGQLAGAWETDGDWSLSVTGGTNNGCKVSDGLSLPTGSLIGEISSEDGDVTGLFEIRGDITTTLLPAGVNAWDAGFRFIYDGTNAGSYVEFIASAGIGVAQGRIAFDGTFALNADFTVPFGNSNIAFDGDIKRETPGGAVVYDVGGSVGLTFQKGSLSGSARLTNSQFSVTGSATLACPVSGSITGGVSTSLPLDGGKNWSLGLTGGAAQGCQVTKEFGLGAGTGVSGQLKSVNGVVSLAIDANATLNTTLIPTKTSFSAGFKFAASQGNYSVAVNGSTQGAGFSAAVESDGRFNLSFNLDDLALGGVSLGAKGTINRTVAGGPVAYSISGSLAGQAKLYDNLFFEGGSLSIDSQGGLSFAGTIRQNCTTGSLRASASGKIVDSRNWSFDAKGIASACTLGRAATFNGTTFFADIDSVNNKVTYNAGVGASQINLFTTSFLLIGRTTTWLTNVSASISNTCVGCQEGGKNRITFRGTGNAKFTLLFLPSTVSATVDGVFDFSGTTIRRVSINITKINWNIFTAGVQAALVGALECDTEKGFTT